MNLRYARVGHAACIALWRVDERSPIKPALCCAREAGSERLAVRQRACGSRCFLRAPLEIPDHRSQQRVLFCTHRVSLSGAEGSGCSSALPAMYFSDAGFVGEESEVGARNSGPPRRPAPAPQGAPALRSHPVARASSLPVKRVSAASRGAARRTVFDRSSCGLVCLTSRAFRCGALRPDWADTASCSARSGRFRHPRRSVA